MDMRRQDERRFAVKLTHLDRYRFSSQASEDGRLHGAPYISDEPDPVGDASGPATPALLGSALGHCLSAALLEMLRKSGVEVLGNETDAVVVVRPNEAGLPRIDHVDITIRPQIAELTPAVQGCEDNFGCHCTVTCSVRKGIDVRVNVDWQVVVPA
jgi:organic hydroperoxide reductase OsmC/OhrA